MNTNTRKSRTLGPRLLARRSFTLIELLVAIAIISLLAAILLPALGMAKERGKTIVCLNNLKQIGIMLHLYSDDNDGYMIPAEYDTANGALTRDGWVSILVSKGYATASLSPVKTQAVDRESVFKCPSGLIDVTTDALTISSRSDPNGAKAFAYPFGASSKYVDCWYGINAITSTNSVANYPFCRVPLDGGTTVLHKMSTVDSVVSRMPMVYDGWWMHNRNDERINARHMNRTRTNVLYFDGHAATLDTFHIAGTQDANANDPDWMY